MSQFPVQGIYYLNTGERTAIILKFICPFCKKDIYFTGAFSDLGALVKFGLMTFCPECDNDFSWMDEGGIRPKLCRATFWVSAAKRSKAYYDRKEARTCYYETTHMQILKHSSEKNSRRRKDIKDTAPKVEGDYYAS